MSRTYNVSLQQNKKPLAKEHKKKFPYKILLGFLIIIAVLGGGAYYLKKYAASCTDGSCTLINNPIVKPIVNTIEPKLDEQDGLTNILIVGIDTRGPKSGLMNTDTMIIVTVDHTNKTVVMTSFPRDLWATYKLPNGHTTSSKLNSAYASGYVVGGEDKAFPTLIGALETITGLKINYYGKITLEGFVQLIDTLGGVDIDVPSYYKDAYPKSELPDDLQKQCKPYYHDGIYCLFEFQKGEQHLDAEHALIYARMRLMSPLGDFDRAARQQRVIESVKKKVFSSDTLLDPVKLWDIFNIVKNNVETSTFDVNDIRAALNLRKEVNTDEIGHVVLDPYFGNNPGKYIYRPTDPAFAGRGYFIIARDTTYKEIQTKLEYIRKYPGIYNEGSMISIYNATGTNKLETDYAKEIDTENPLFIFKFTNKVIADPTGKYTGISILKVTKEDKPATEKYLKEYFKVDEIITTMPEGLKASGEDYIIMIGKKPLASTTSTSSIDTNETSEMHD
jgi:LCP family protein required for cell wall assembly